MYQHHHKEQALQQMQQQSPYSNTQSYINSVNQSYRRKSYLPSYQIKYQLSAIRQKLLQQKQQVIGELKQQRMLQETIGEEQLGRYYAKKKQSQEYNTAIGIINRIKAIYKLVEQHIIGCNALGTQSFIQDNTQNTQQKLIIKNNQHLLSQQQVFAHFINAIQQFHTFYTNLQQIQSNHKENTKKIGKQIHLVFINKLYVQLMRMVMNKKQKQSQNIKLKIQEIIKRYNLPLRRNEKPKQRENTNLQIIDKLFIQRLLHRQACQYALHNYLSSIIPLITQQSARKQQLQSLPQYKSLFFSIYYSKLQSSIQYLFIQKHESHSFIQPNWMFEYLQQVFVNNYQWLRANVLQGLKGEMQGNLLVYILQYGISELFYENIKLRLQTDLSQQQFTNTPLHYYKFLDSLYQLQQKLNITFSQQFSLVENLLIEFQLKPDKQSQKYKILQKCFDYEHQWIQQKIFKDFWQNINYSAIDLKNIQTYNIVTNFNVLFQKLYTKFSTLYEPQLVKRVFTFYQQQIKNLVAHIKTSLERIYYHSGLDKLSVILAFKRVDNEFRSGLGQFISKDLSFQKYIKKQYYDYILQLFNQLAVQQLAVYSRKMLKAVTQLQHLFSAQSITEDDHLLLINRSQQIFKKWSTKLQQLNLVYPFKDSKIKNQFFVFLQSVSFTQKGTYFLYSQKGITLFLQFYQPFLKVYYNSQIFNLLKMVILMDKKQQLQYLKSNSTENISFLLQTEINSIKKIKIK